MFRFIRLAAIAAMPLVAGALVAVSARAEPPVDIHVEYDINLIGAPIAELAVQMRLGDDGYTVSGSGATVGLIDLVSQIRFSGQTTGEVDGDLIRPDLHRYLYSERGRERQVELAYNGAGLPEVSVNPPFRESYERVPLPHDRLAGAIDPASLFVVPAVPGADLLSPANCDRAFAVIDGQVKIEVSASLIAIEQMARTNGVDYQGAVMHCAMRARPVGGHREGDFLTKMAGRNIEVWLAPAAGGRYYLPIRVSLPTPYGQADLVARRIVGGAGALGG